MEYFGTGKISYLKSILKDEQIKNILLVRGKGSYRSSGAEKILSEILREYSVIEFKDFAVNPEIEDVKRGISLYKKSNIDLIIAVGGGSVIDMAKLINALSYNSGEPEYLIINKKDLSNKTKTLIAIPTTSGAGSEATHFAVVYIDKKKYSLAKEWIKPTYVITDPELTLSLNSYITACTGFDALGHALESYWSVNSTDESTGYSLEALKLILNNLEDCVKYPTLEKRILLSKGAYLAGKAINITKTTAPHALSYHFTSYYNIPHGHAVGLILGGFVSFNNELTEETCNDSRGIKYVRERLKKLVNILKYSSIEDFSQSLYHLLDSLGLESSIYNIGLDTDEKIELLASSINVERSKNNPRKITKEQILEFIKNYCVY